MSPLLLTPVEAAAALGVGRSTVFRLIQTGALPSVRIGANRRIRVADVEAYVAGLGA
ncbi:helix-turn-helix domain-containing protein [Amnibacterium kyonggiense]